MIIIQYLFGDDVNIGVDIDSVSCDMLPSVCDYVNACYSTNFSADEVTSWNHSFITNDGKRISLPSMIEECFQRRGFLRTLPVMKGAKETIWWLKENNENVTFITSRSSFYATDTISWINMHFGESPIIHVRDDKNHDLDVLIDDAPRHISAFKGNLAIAFNQPWNESVEFHSTPSTKVQRAKSWYHIRKIMEEEFDISSTKKYIKAVPLGMIEDRIQFGF